MNRHSRPEFPPAQQRAFAAADRLEWLTLAHVGGEPEATPGRSAQ